MLFVARSVVTPSYVSLVAAESESVVFISLLVVRGCEVNAVILETVVMFISE